MTAVPDALIEDRWQAWLLEHNRRGTRIAFWLTIIIYPMFGILDWLVVPREWLPLILTTRAVVTVWSLFVIVVLRTPLFDRSWRLLTSAHSVILGAGISVMTIALGGFQSGYYAGINLGTLGCGILFVWSARQAAITNSITILTYLIPCGILASPQDWLAGVPNLFFLISTATVVSVAQGFGFRSERETLTNQIMLERTKSTLEEAHEQLKRLDRYKSQFFANITHELKTPLAMILSPLELMTTGEMGRIPDQQMASLQSMFRSGMKLLKLIQDLLDLSKLEESRLRLKIAEHDLAAYLEGLVVQAQPLAQRKRIEMTFESDGAPAMVWCDLDRLERVFVNLLSNAAKFTSEGGHIRVRLADHGDRVRVAVVDDGPGFPREMAEKVFERFFQVDMEGTRKFGGTGIGLALARELIGLHGGRIWAESDTGEGAAFFVELVKDREHFRPEALDRRAERRDVVGGKRQADQGITDWSVALAAREDYRFLDIAEATERRIVERDPDEGRRRYSVLVVEDTPDIIRVVHLSLRQHFKVLAAEDGLKGLERALMDPPSLIITDLMMPGIDGHELTRRLRADPRTRHIPIVMLTARGDMEDRVAGLESGVNAYLTKPFSPKELLTTVRSLLNLQETQADLLLTQRMDSLERVASGLAHEINNPLNYVKNSVEQVRRDGAEYLELIRSTFGREPADYELARLEKVEARIRKMFETADAGIRRISGTVDLMRKYSREGYSRQPVPHDVFASVRDVVDIVLPATGREVRVETEFVGDGTIECVPEEFHQVLTNLVQNAIEAAPEGTGRVRVTGEGADGEVVLRVRDNGPGMPPEVRDRIFTPFFTTKAPGRGLGLGLTIAWRVVASVGGTVDVHSAPGEGTEFVVRVPRAATSASRAPAATV